MWDINNDSKETAQLGPETMKLAEKTQPSEEADGTSETHRVRL